MKKFGKIASLVAFCAVVLGLSALATSCSPTFGLEQVDASTISAATFASSYSGSYTSITRDDNGKQTGKTTEDISNWSGSIVKGYAYTAATLVSESVYANSDFTHVVYYNYTKNSKNVVTSEVCYNLYANK